MTQTINSYLIDSGATISILKENKLLLNYPVNTDIRCGITGIQDGIVDTIGKTTDKLLIQGCNIQQVT